MMLDIGEWYRLRKVSKCRLRSIVQGKLGLIDGFGRALIPLKFKSVGMCYRSFAESVTARR